MRHRSGVCSIAIAERIAKRSGSAYLDLLFDCVAGGCYEAALLHHQRGRCGAQTGAAGGAPTHQGRVEKAHVTDSSPIKSRAWQHKVQVLVYERTLCKRDILSQCFHA